MTLEVNQFLYSIRENREVILNAVAIFFILANMSFYAAHPPDAVQQSNIEDIRGVTIGFGQGTSMEPVIQEGDILVVVNTGFENVEEGDIVAYRAYDGDENKYLTHKYLGDHITKGVNNDRVDPTMVNENNYGGTVEVVIPTSGVYNVILSVLR